MVVTILVDPRDGEKKKKKKREWQRNEQAIKVQLKASSRENSRNAITRPYSIKNSTRTSHHISLLFLELFVRPIDGSFVKRRNPIHGQIKSLQFQRVQNEIKQKGNKVILFYKRL